MGDRRAVLRHGEQVLLRVVDGLRDRERNLARLAVADADAVDLVADHDERREREAPAALDDLGDTVDLDHALLELANFLAGDHFTFDNYSKLQSSLTRGLCEGLDASVVQVAAAVEHDGLDAGLLRGLGDRLADLGCLIRLVALERLLQAEPARAGERAAGLVVDQLGEDSLVRAEDGEARPLGRARDLAANPAMTALARLACGDECSCALPDLPADDLVA